jgi:hypothetical protein
VPVVDEWIAVLVKEEICERYGEIHPAGNDAYRFRHDLVQDAVYALLSDPERKLGHRLAGQYLEQAGERDPMILAEHARRAGEPERAIPFYVLAAEHSYERYDREGMRIRAERGIAAGARDTDLGILLATQSIAAALSGSAVNPLPPGLAALPLLPKGSPWWCRNMGHLFLSCIHGAEMATLNSLVQLFATVEPHPDARGPYADAASTLIIMFSYLGLREPARSFLASLQKAVGPVMESDANIKALANSGYAWYLRSLEPAPYQAMSVASVGARACEAAGNLRILALLRLCLGMTLSELGDSVTGEKQLRATLALFSQGDEFVKGNLEAYLAMLLVRREDDKDLEEACTLAEKVLKANMSPIYNGAAKTVLAHAWLLRARPELAAQEARQAIALLAPMRVYQMDAQVLLIRALQKGGRVSEACSLAEEALTSLGSLGGLGHGEVPVRLAVAEARQANEDLSGARQALREAYTQVQLRAQSIPDMEWRTRFLTQVPGNARVLSLAASWGVVPPDSVRV